MSGNNDQRSLISNKLEQSEHKSSATTSKGLIYLGKQPVSRNTEYNVSNSFTLPPEHQRKNSYHKLLNDKSIQREKKSISYNEANHKNSSFLK